MNAFLINRVHSEPSDSRVTLKVNRNVPYHIFHKDWVVVGLHGDMPFVNALQQGINRG